MNQKDPNNISGLLKMHLRENNLLCDDSIQSISQVLTQDMVCLTVKFWVCEIWTLSLIMRTQNSERVVMLRICVALEKNSTNCFIQDTLISRTR